ncbi:MAG: hypothetical protein GXO26_07210 [Crenarchaeota archaeon]|nr:hypothetical protein [Thermoproteota archaeon]
MLTRDVKVVVSSPSRIHFGIINPFRIVKERYYTCAGLAVEQPRTIVEASFDGDNDSDPEILDVLRRLEHLFDIDTSGISIRILSKPPRHVGLGSTTQLKLSIARAVLSLFNIDNICIEYLAKVLGRGDISGVGTYAHAYGGLIVDMGKKNIEDFPKLYIRLEFPQDWYIVLARGEGRGPDEKTEHVLFTLSCPRDLIYEASFYLFNVLIPGVVEKDFELFCTGLERLQYSVGKMFEKAQGGIFSTYSNELINIMRKMNLRGVGQSSWGPTVYGFTISREHAEKCVKELKEVGFWAMVVRADNNGARILRL